MTQNTRSGMLEYDTEYKKWNAGICYRVQEVECWHMTSSTGSGLLAEKTGIKAIHRIDADLNLRHHLVNQQGSFNLQ